MGSVIACAAVVLVLAVLAFLAWVNRLTPNELAGIRYRGPILRWLVAAAMCVLVAWFLLRHKPRRW